MRSSSFYLCASAAVLCASVAPALATVTISSQPTQNMACYGTTTCAPTAVDAVLNVQDLETMLASGNATVTTTGQGVEAGGIVVAARLEWSTANLLELEAFHSIKFNRPVTVAGTGGVWLFPNTGGRGGEFACDDRGRLEFSNLSGALVINGASYTLVNSVASLASAIAANPNGAYALAKNYDARKDGTYTSSPIATVFTGAFNGLGNTISNLSINDPTENAYVGLFAETTGSIANVRVLNETVQGGSGSPNGTSTEFIGGLVGYAPGGSLAHGYTSGSVSGGDNVAVGGLLGMSGNAVSASGSAATVTDGSLGNAGGLIGFANSGSIEDSWATGTVSGTVFIGGLIGFNAKADIEHSWSSGSVSSSDGWTYAGGLVGMSQTGQIDRSFASGAVTCQFTCGGLLGFAGGGIGISKVSRSFATGSVSGNAGATACTGGLIGVNEWGEITNSYATGAATAAQAGGLECQNINTGGYDAISYSYSTGAVTGQSGFAGGLLGGDEFASTLKRSYWDMTTSGITDPGQGAGNVANDPGITGLSDSELKSRLPRGFSARIWSENPNINGGLPYLIANPPPN